MGKGNNKMGEKSLKRLRRTSEPKTEAADTMRDTIMRTGLRRVSCAESMRFKKLAHSLKAIAQPTIGAS